MKRLGQCFWCAKTTKKSSDKTGQSFWVLLVERNGGVFVCVCALGEMREWCFLVFLTRSSHGQNGHVDPSNHTIWGHFKKKNPPPITTNSTNFKQF